MDYQSLIDTQTWAFIKRTEDWYPSETASFSIEQQRNIYDAMCKEFFVGYPERVKVTNTPMGGVPCRHYTLGPSPKTVIYLHGGGFVVGGLESHDDICAEICSSTGLDVVSVDYRLSPEHKHPAAYDDALAVLTAVATQTKSPILLIGDSAGGNLAAALCHGTRGMGHTIIGQVLIYPGLGGDINKGSYIEHANAPMLTRDDILFYKGVRCVAGAEPVQDPTYAPLHDTSFAGLPATSLIAAQCDPLCDDCPDYETALLAANVPVTRVVATGMVHGYLRARTTVDRARKSFDYILSEINRLAQTA